MHGFQIRFDFDRLPSTLLYLYKVMRVRHINVLDLLRKYRSQWKRGLWALCLMYFPYPDITPVFQSLRLYKRHGWITDQLSMWTAVHSKFIFKEVLDDIGFLRKEKHTVKEGMSYIFSVNKSEAILCEIAPCLQPSVNDVPTSCFLLCMLNHYQH